MNSESTRATSDTTPHPKCPPRLGLPHLAFRAGALLVAIVGTGATYAEWQAQVWRPAEAAQPALAGPTANPDGDRLANFAEYALGRDPLKPDATELWGNLPALEARDGAANGWLRASAAASEARLDFTAAGSLAEGAAWDAAPAHGFSVTEASAGAGSIGYALQMDAAAAAAGFLHIAAVSIAAPPSGPKWVWLEAEGSFGGESNVALSADRMTWVGPDGSVQKSVNIPSAGDYTLWVRKFWNPQAIRWRVGTGDWREVRSASLTDLILLDGNAGRRVGWFNAGSAALVAGTQNFRLEVLTGDSNTTAYDCFLLTREGFTPRGKLKPDEGSGVSEPGWFAFEPASDPLTYSPIDLRFLNERLAGEHGFIRTQGPDFIHEGTGEAVRFWAVNVGLGFVNSADADLDLFARAMAKRGVNLVRIHGAAYEDSGANVGQVKPELVARVHYFIHALKREGIYSSLSIYFPLWVTLGPENTDFPGYNGQHPFALPYFSEPFQPLYQNWWRGLLEPINPHTGIALKDDPAVAMLEMINEDSTLFWTFDPNEGASGNIPDPQRAILEKRFGDWLLAKYPGVTLSQIRNVRWQGLATFQDDFAAGRVGFRPLWNIANERRPRDRDTAQFLTELMKDWHTAIYHFLKQDLGSRALVYCSNWKTASEQYLDPLDKYANSVGDFFDRHGYFGGRHEGNNASWNIEPGQRYDDRAAVKFRNAAGTGDDFGNPLWDLGYNDRPSTITEINWPLPNRYRADMVVLGAAYGALQGSDAIFWFAAGEPTWQGLPGKFAIQTPGVLGQFPATALIYRQGLVRTGQRVVDIDLGVDDLYALKGTPLPAPQNFDSLRGNDVPPGATLTNVSVIDSLAFLVGGVNVNFIENGTPQSQVRDLSPYIDRPAKRVVSETGELRWDWDAGLVTLDAPAAQGATGFLGAAGSIQLDRLEIESPLEYGSVVLVAMDGKPIAESARLLLQVASEEKPWQWETETATGLRTITNRGTVPLLVREMAGTVRLKRADAASLTVTPLDANGYRVGPPINGAAEITLLPDRLYYLVER